MLIRLFRRLWTSMRKPEPVDALEPVRPRVMPDPEWTAELERRRAALDYQPENGFLHQEWSIR